MALDAIGPPVNFVLVATRHVATHGDVSPSEARAWGRQHGIRLLVQIVLHASGDDTLPHAEESTLARLGLGLGSGLGLGLGSDLGLGPGFYPDPNPNPNPHPNPRQRQAHRGARRPQAI